MKHTNFRNSWLENFESLKKALVSRFGEDVLRLLMDNISKLATYHYNKKKYILLGKEKELYNFLIENSYNPFTIYRWSLLEKIPEDIKHQLKTGNITQKLASKIQFKRRHETRSKVCIDIKLMGINLVRSM